MAKKILVIANETAASDQLQAAVGGPTDGSTQVLVVAPALNSRLRHWCSDTGAAEDAAHARLRICIARLAARGIRASGRIGDSDPLQATIDALHFYPADEIVISTHPEHRSNWLAKRLVERVAEHYDGPILHVVVDGERALVAA
jgi:GNAT superfamily N-acetyltransferase